MPFVRAARAWWDSHGQNFETHQEMVPELDHVMATLIDDLEGAAACSTRRHGDHARRVRPHAADQPQPGPRPLRHPPGAARSPAAARRAAPSTAKTRRDRQHGRTTARSGRAELFATIYAALGINPEKNYHDPAIPVPADRSRRPPRRLPTCWPAENLMYFGLYVGARLTTPDGGRAHPGYMVKHDLVRARLSLTYGPDAIAPR